MDKKIQKVDLSLAGLNKMDKNYNSLKDKVDAKYKKFTEKGRIKIK